MYPYQRTPMGNPYIGPIVYSGYLWVMIPKNPVHTMGTPRNCPLILGALGGFGQVRQA